MIASFTRPFKFSLPVFFQQTDSLLTKMNIVHGWTSILSSTDVNVPIGANQTIPDWCYLDELFNLSVAAGYITVVTPPVDSTVVNITNNEATVALPLTGSPANLYLTTNCPNGALINLETTSTPNYNGGANTIVLTPNIVTKVPVGANTYLSAILVNSIAAGTVSVVAAA